MPSGLTTSNFYSRASCEARLNIAEKLICYFRFLLTRLMRGAALCQSEPPSSSTISTHAPHARRGATSASASRYVADISTHAPHARRGPCSTNEWVKSAYFYSRASCEARRRRCSSSAKSSRFLLTRLMRGAAAMSTENVLNTLNFYSRASCEARPSAHFS